MVHSGPSLDGIDLRLLEILQVDAGQTLRELGDQVGLSPSAVQRRIAGYRRTGLMLGQVAVLDPHRVGAMVQAVVLLTLVEESMEHHRLLADRLRARPEIQQCYAVAGPWDYVVVLSSSDLGSCHRLGNELFKADPNIRRYETLLVLDTTKTGVAFPLATPGPDASPSVAPGHRTC